MTVSAHKIKRAQGGLKKAYGLDTVLEELGIIQPVSQTLGHPLNYETKILDVSHKGIVDAKIS